MFDGLVAFAVDRWHHDCGARRMWFRSRPGSPMKEGRFGLGTFRFERILVIVHIDITPPQSQRGKQFFRSDGHLLSKSFIRNAGYNSKICKMKHRRFPYLLQHSDTSINVLELQICNVFASNHSIEETLQQLKTKLTQFWQATPYLWSARIFLETYTHVFRNIIRFLQKFPEVLIWSPTWSPIWLSIWSPKIVVTLFYLNHEVSIESPL
ncbi:hypothetical protein TNCV_3026841 [Trichonephila clavipes]|nr:hypothetical protein TNCV_3026841 [Trichonephila clavipes]